MTTATTADQFERALTAEPTLRAIDRLVDTLCALVRPTDILCYGCVWEQIVKPLTVPLVGWCRPGRATTDTEKWMRTSEAFDVVTDKWIDRLEKADPGNGHGLGTA